MTTHREEAERFLGGDNWTDAKKALFVAEAQTWALLAVAHSNLALSSNAESEE